MLWDIEWFDAHGASLKQKQGLDRDAAEQQAQRWLTKRSDSRVYLYRRRGAISVLVQILTA